MGELLNEGAITTKETAAGALQIGFYNVTPVSRTAAPAALAAFAAGANGLSTEANMKALVEMVTEMRTRLKNLGLWE